MTTIRESLQSCLECCEGKLLKNYRDVSHIGLLRFVLRHGKPEILDLELPVGGTVCVRHGWPKDYLEIRDDFWEGRGLAGRLLEILDLDRAFAKNTDGQIRYTLELPKMVVALVRKTTYSESLMP